MQYQAENEKYQEVERELLRLSHKVQEHMEGRRY